RIDKERDKVNYTQHHQEYNNPANLCFLKQVSLNGQNIWQPAFISTRSELSSSAPVSPVSSYNSPTPQMERPLPPPVTIYRSTRSQNLRNNSPVLYNRVPSPFQSDVSYSAPSSPRGRAIHLGKLSLLKPASKVLKKERDMAVDDYAKQRDESHSRQPWASNFSSSCGLQGHRRLPRRVPPSPLHQKRRLKHCNANRFNQIHESPMHHRMIGRKQDLLRLLEKLGLESLHKCLVKNGYSRVDQLGGITRQRLLDIGVSNAEVIASLLTAAQLLTDSTTETPVCYNNEERRVLGIQHLSGPLKIDHVSFGSKAFYANEDARFAKSAEHCDRRKLFETPRSKMRSLES
uniref:SAM domain-containing protein n=1 Tax=Mesocestoides corti TaxID=53468 RepID=A0A5K3EVA3_MESCO